MLKAGDKAPNFVLETDSGRKVTLAELGDKPVVLFFYPKDDTPGCTIECKEFRDALPKFEAKAHVLGISPDDRESHEQFRNKFGLNFPLLSDPGGTVASQFGVWAETQWGLQNKRTTFIIRGTQIDRVFENVKPQGHAAEVLEALG
jgi:thioredoxin-dependent peroxiredoxin